MRLFYASIIIACYLFISLILPLRISLPVKMLLGALLFAAGLKYPFYQHFGGSFFNPDLPWPVQPVCEAVYCAFILLFFLALIKDITGLALRCCKRRLPFSCGLRHSVFLLAALASGSWSVFQAIRVPDVREVRADIPGLPAVLDGFTLVQLSDLHIGPLLRRDWLERVVEKVNDLHPDAIVLTGDMVDGYTGQRKDALAPLGKLQAKFGVYGIPGNHEYYYNAPAWSEAFSSMGIRMLENAHAVLPDGLVLGGVTDSAAKSFGMPGPDVDRAFAGAPAGTRILLSHRPSYRCTPSPGIALQLSGHTHGGHLFFLRPLIAHFNGGFVSGMYRTSQGGLLYVSSGTGLWNGFSCRLAVPSEITLLTLHSL